MTKKNRGLAIYFIIFLVLFSSCSAEYSENIRRIEEQTKSILSLHTSQYNYRDILYFGDEEKFLGLITTATREVLFKIEINVRAGIDIENMEKVGVQLFPDNSINIELPEPQILFTDADESSIKQYFLKEEGKDIEWIMIQDIVEESKAAIESDAIERGILTEAKQNAELALGAFFKLAGFTHVGIQFKSTPQLPQVDETSEEERDQS